MNADEFLSQIQKYDTLIDNKLSERQKLWCLATKITVPTDREVVQTSGISDKVGNIAAKLVDLENEIDSIIDEYIDIQRECIGVIDRLADVPLQYIIIHKHYVQGKAFTEIEKEEHYSYPWIIKQRDKALRRVEEILQEKMQNSKRV
ncbi:MAG: hypothetical protein IIW88_08590 [Clostridia bacterium]|nr:hypothetical protein [Clostridia bacterium]